MISLVYGDGSRRTVDVTDPEDLAFVVGALHGRMLELEQARTARSVAESLDARSIDNPHGVAVVPVLAYRPLTARDGSGEVWFHGPCAVTWPTRAGVPAFCAVCHVGADARPTEWHQLFIRG